MNILPMLATLGEKLVTGTAAVQSPADEMIIMLAQSCHVVPAYGGDVGPHLRGDGFGSGLNTRMQ